MTATKLGNGTLTLVGVAALFPCMSFAFNSGSTGVDGAFNPAISTEVQLPPSGIFNFTSVDIPASVVVRFKRNAANTPVVMLVSGNVTITGQINITGGKSPDTGNGGDGNLGDDGQPGLGGPGGYDGGRGGGPNNLPAGNGLGPGGGPGGLQKATYKGLCDGIGGTFSKSFTSSSTYCDNQDRTINAYGSPLLLPLVGGSGAGGGSGGQNFAGTGGGGGGGAILIAASGTINLNTPGPIYYSIDARAGESGSPGNAVGFGADGGHGSGGAIRLVATTIKGASGSPGYLYAGPSNDHHGGRIRLEAETLAYTLNSEPPYTFDKPGPLFIAGLPTLKIKSVAGVNSPAIPSGAADIALPANITNPVTVAFESTGVPTGNTVTLTVTPSNGAATQAVSPVLTGTTDLATASVNVTLPMGHSILSATTSYTVVAALGDLLAPYAQGERVERVTLVAGLDGSSQAILTTVSGKNYTHNGPLPTFGS